MESFATQSSNLLQDRQRCLSLLGIKQWYSRYNLPNAGATPALFYSLSNLSKPNLSKPSQSQSKLKQAAAFDKADAGPIADQAAGLNIIKPGNFVDARVRIDQLTADTPPSPPVQVEHAEKVVASELASQHEPKLLHSEIRDGGLTVPLCMLAAGQCLVFYEAQSSASHKQEHTFLSAFLRFAMQTDLRDSQAATLAWPVFSSKVLLADQLQHFKEVFIRWASVHNWSEVRFVFYFGYQYERVEQLLLDLKLAGDSECVFVPIKLTIAELLGAPVKKRGLWDSVSALIQKYDQ